MLSAGVFSNPIIIRHDVDDAKYIKLGEQFRDSICNLNVIPNVPDCMATFLDEEWVITAAHCAMHIKRKMDKGDTHQIEFRNEFFEVEKVHIHPKYSQDTTVDLALIKLKKKAPRVKSFELYRDSDELGQTVFVVGYGDFGNGLTGPQKNDKKLRAGTNKVDEVTDVWLK